MTAQRQTIVQVDLDSLRHNLRQIRKLIGSHCAILGVVKANAYGHGAIMVSRTLAEEGVAMLGVSRVAEGIELREAGITTPILVMGGVLEDEAERIVCCDLQPVVYHLPVVAALANVARALGRVIRIHVKVDTGMGRIGLAPQAIMDAASTMVQ